MFQVGDIVILKSGGPKMTVCGVPSEHTSQCRCQWFDESGELQRSTFPPSALKSVSEAAG
jgi:uncharacterized protein YodC (DUF2158 family)